MKILFVGLIPPDSHNPEERRFVQELSRHVTEVLYLRGIGIKGFTSRRFTSLFRQGNRNRAAAPIGRLLIAPPRLVLRRLNVVWLRRQIRKLTAGRNAEWILWTRFPSPELIDAAEGLFSRIVYEPIDRYSASQDFTLKERDQISKAEAVLKQRATVIAGARVLADQFCDAAGGSTWLPFGRDLASGSPWRLPRQPDARIRLGVVAEFDWRVDELLIGGIARQRPNWTIELIGPRVGRWGRTIEGLPNVQLVGPMPNEEIAERVKGFSVALIPYAVNEWTNACLPIKVYEYLAAGRPVVSSKLPELRPFSDVVCMVAGDDFVKTVEELLATDRETGQRLRVEASRRFSLQERAKKSVEFLQGAPAQVASA